MFNLPDDMIYEIYRKLHRTYMKTLKDEIYDFVEILEFRKENNLGDDLDEWD